jgi:AraC-like DNA-binding protein
VDLGEAEILETISVVQHDQFRDALLKSGLELMDDKKSMLIEKIKNAIVELVHYSQEPLTIKFSEFLSQKLNHDYTYLANLFSDVQGTTIEKFFISHKIERVKELLVYNELNLTEIAFLMHYSSVAHLSAQFKKMTGLTPSHFKQLREKRRNMLENM